MENLQGSATFTDTYECRGCGSDDPKCTATIKHDDPSRRADDASFARVCIARIKPDAETNWFVVSRTSKHYFPPIKTYDGCVSLGWRDGGEQGDEIEFRTYEGS